MPYKTIIFDFFGVISSGVAQSWFDEYFPKGISQRLKLDWCSAIDEGQLSGDEVWQKLGHLVLVPPQQVRQEWFSFAEINSEVVDAIERLRQTYQIGLCTNAGWSFVRELLQAHNLDRLFDEIVISSEVHAVKPGDRILRIALDRLQTQPDESVFVDDNAENVRAAQAIGMKGILFRSVADLAHL
jgi:HAD superfamily hydrolase (TIGR01509 family)